MYRILLVDDEPLLVKGLKRSLEQEGYAVVTARTGREALDRMAEGGFDLVLLDLMLPEIDGISVCQQIRRSSSVPVIMLTARDDDVEKIVGLEVGADDYLTKPFNTRELLARIKALLRRVRMDHADARGEGRISRGDLVIDVPGRKAMVRDRAVGLTPREFDILLLLARHPGRVYSRENLLELVWGYDFHGDLRTVDVHIRRLREKIEADPGNPEYILTRWGAGYCFKELA